MIVTYNLCSHSFKRVAPSNFHVLQRTKQWTIATKQNTGKYDIYYCSSEKLEICWKFQVFVERFRSLTDFVLILVRRFYKGTIASEGDFKEAFVSVLKFWLFVLSIVQFSVSRAMRIIFITSVTIVKYRNWKSQWESVGKSNWVATSVLNVFLLYKLPVVEALENFGNIVKVSITAGTVLF